MENKYIDDSFCNVCPIMIKRYFDIQENRYIVDESYPYFTLSCQMIYFCSS